MTDTYLYDGDYSSLLALLVELMKKRITPGNICSYRNYKMSLLDNSIYLKVEEKEKNIVKLKSALPKNVLWRIYYVFLSNHKDKEMLLYSFIKYAIHFQEKVIFYRRIDCINEVIKISERVGREAHKLKGFLRFQKMENHFFYAKYSSDNFVLPILVKHFKNRFCFDNWIIQDDKRKIYAIYFNKEVFYLEEKDILKLNLEIDSKEENIENLWKVFHKTVTIKERENKKCQMNFMPKKYWKNLLEMEDEA